MTEGQRWAEELLGELRDSRYLPRAWIRFLAESFRRAGVRRAERRTEHRQLAGLAAVGLAVWSAVAVVRPWLALTGALWWIAVLLMADLHLGMLERADGTPVRGLGAETVLTLARAGIVPALVATGGAPFVALFAAAGATDVLDGRLARSRDRVTRLGFWLDGSADTLVLGAAAIGLTASGRLPAWALVLLLARYGVPWLLLPALYFGTARAPDLGGTGAGRVAGLVVFAGLAAAALELQGGAALVAAGSLAGLAATAVYRLWPPSATMRPSS